MQQRFSLCVNADSCLFNEYFLLSRPAYYNHQDPLIVSALLLLIASTLKRMYTYVAIFTFFALKLHTCIKKSLLLVLLFSIFAGVLSRIHVVSLRLLHIRSDRTAYTGHSNIFLVGHH
jgi:hypothetical protein